jgi:hypothetical protein
MKRDLELIRKMMLAIEDSASGWAPNPLRVDGYTEEQVGYHAWLLIDADLAKGEDVTTMGSGGPEGMITTLTWEGHEFIDAARDNGRWTTAMGKVAARGGAVTLDVLKELLIDLMRGTFGLS